MQKLHAKYIKIVAAGGNLSGASEMKLAKDAISLTGEGVVVEHITSENPNPEERHEIGTKFEVRGVLGAASQSEFTTLLGGALNSSVYTKTQGIRALSSFDIRVAVFRSTDGLLILKDFTNMHFEAKIEETYEQGNRFYLPFRAMSTATSTYSSDNSAS